MLRYSNSSIGYFNRFAFFRQPVFGVLTIYEQSNQQCINLKTESWQDTSVKCLNDLKRAFV